MKKSIFIYLLLLCSISIFAQDVIAPPRTCTVCKVTKPASEFSGDSKTCKVCAQKKPETRTCTSCKKTKALSCFSENSKICKECVGKASERSYQLGNDYFHGRNGKNKDYSEAVKCYQKAADMGHIEAMVCLADCYENGYGVIKSENMMVVYEKKAAALGNAMAQCRLGKTYFLGVGGEKQNYTEAVKWFRKSAEQGNSYGQRFLGLMYHLGGGGIKQDISEAAKWYRKSAEQGDSIAQWTLGLMYDYGGGMKKDLKQAKYWYEKSATQGYVLAKNSLAILASREQDICDGNCVDLDLPSGTLWATRNVGASKPEEYGNYYAWGETKGYKEGKRDFSWNTYKWCNGDSIKQLRYCNNSKYGNNGFIDKKTELDLEDDAAYDNWGSDWRTPTYHQIKELIDYCNWEWTIINGVNGRKVTSKTNGNSIFIPASGWKFSVIHMKDSQIGGFWSRTLYPNESDKAYCLFFDSSEVDWDMDVRFHGSSVRPVHK